MAGPRRGGGGASHASEVIERRAGRTLRTASAAVGIAHRAAPLAAAVAAADRRSHSDAAAEAEAAAPPKHLPTISS